MNLNIRLPIFTEVDNLSEEVKKLDSFDLLTTVIKERFQHQIAGHLISLNAKVPVDSKEEIIKSSTAKGTNLENAVGVQRLIYGDIGRKFACTEFMFDSVSKQLEISDIELFYEILFGEPGFRDGDTLVVTQSGEQYNFEAPIKIQEELTKLLDWHHESFKNPEIHPLTHITFFHFEFLRIHPYFDGNGRIGRLLMSILLMKFGYLPILINTNERLDYYKALESGNNGDLLPLLHFISNKELGSLKEFTQSAEYLSIHAKRELESQLGKIKGKEKCFVLTEDENYEGLLSVIFESSGFNMDETTFISYEGCSKLSSVTLFTVFANEKLPHIKIIVHRDRDYLTDNEIQKEVDGFSALNVEFFITDGTDVESHFVNAKHINHCHPAISKAKGQALIDECLTENEETSLQRLRIKEFGANHKNKPTHLAQALIDLVKSNKMRFSYGKKLLGLLKSKIQLTLKANSDIEVTSPHVASPQLIKLAEVMWKP